MNSGNIKFYGQWQVRLIPFEVKVIEFPQKMYFNMMFNFL
jgi:hypothetical protein